MQVLALARCRTVRRQRPRPQANEVVPPQCWTQSWTTNHRKSSIVWILRFSVPSMVRSFGYSSLVMLSGSSAASLILLVAAQWWLMNHASWSCSSESMWTVCTAQARRCQIGYASSAACSTPSLLSTRLPFTSNASTRAASSCPGGSHSSDLLWSGQGQSLCVHLSATQVAN